MFILRNISNTVSVYCRRLPLPTYDIKKHADKVPLTRITGGPPYRAMSMVSTIPGSRLYTSISIPHKFKLTFLCGPATDVS